MHSEIAVAIALTSTALGTLLPILKDRGLVETPVGRACSTTARSVRSARSSRWRCCWGARGAVLSLVVLAAFAAIAVVVALLPARILREGTDLLAVVRRGSDTTAQTTVRLVMLLLVALIAVAAVFDLDIILGAFAAGFILRRTVPDGNEQLEHKLEGLAFGLLIPIFFVTSGMAIDVSAVADEPGVLAAFLALAGGVVRGLPVFVASRYDRIASFDTRESLQVALYSTTGLPLIVAVTGVAVSAGQMSNATASILVAAGAISVLILPMLAGFLVRRSPTSPGDAHEGVSA